MSGEIFLGQIIGLTKLLDQKVTGHNNELVKINIDWIKLLGKENIG